VYFAEIVLNVESICFLNVNLAKDFGEKLRGNA
jgi:hypothetical protein